MLTDLYVGQDVDLETDVSPHYCPACGGVNLEALGLLGRRFHLRCQECGMLCSREIEVLADAWN